jgi:hypothetical protein
MTPAGGDAMSIRPSEEIVVQGGDVARAETYVAPELDSWDRWNYDRTNDLADAVSERYLPSGVAGARDLDHYGSWRVVAEYGPVWVPDAMQPGWVPYSTGRWIWDPYYQWTWIDDAPWGWAPYHYGRWVSLGGYWAWAPGSVVVARPVYAPALVAFFGVTPQVSVGIGIGSSGVGWVALSWGEPILPWWGRPGFIGRPWWGGWGGPRVVNNVVVRQTTVINVTNISYANARVANAVVAVTADHFGRARARETPVHLRVPDKALTHIRGALPVKPNPASLVAGAPKGVRPPEQILSRRVVATRRPQEARLPWRSEAPRPVAKAAEPRYVPAPKRSTTALRRPEFGTQTGPERERAPLPRPFEERGRAAAPATPPASLREQRDVGRSEPKPDRIAPPAAATQPRVVREAAPPRAAQERQPQASRKGETTPQPVQPKKRAELERGELPGKAANRTYKGRDQGKSESRRSQPGGQ